MIKKSNCPSATEKSAIFLIHLKAKNGRDASEILYWVFCKIGAQLRSLFKYKQRFLNNLYLL